MARLKDEAATSLELPFTLTNAELRTDEPTDVSGYWPKVTLLRYHYFFCGFNKHYKCYFQLFSVVVQVLKIITILFPEQVQRQHRKHLPEFPKSLIDLDLSDCKPVKGENFVL